VQEEDRDTVFQGPLLQRRWKKTVSSGMLAYQIKKNCENEMYAQKTLNPKSSLPRSWKCSVVIALPLTPAARSA
jgi:hypothetical protein